MRHPHDDEERDLRTDLEGLQRRVRDDAERFRLIEENVLDYAIFTLDPNGTINTWNEGSRRILGYTSEEVLGQPVQIIYTPEDRAAGDDTRELTQAARTGRASDERWHVRKDGTRFWANGVPTALREDGRLHGFAKILRDFTERKAYQDELEILNLRLKEAMRETHHRVKNNLQIIAAMIDMRLMDCASSISADELRRLAAHIRGLAAIHDLLTEPDMLEDAQSVPTKAFLERLIPYFENLAGGRSFQFQADDVRLPARQATSLALITNELVSNALKHARTGIDLSLTQQDGDAVLVVCDDGPGFTAGFESILSAHIGLEMVNLLSRRDLRGSVHYDDLPTGGARATVRFPLERAAQKAA